MKSVNQQVLLSLADTDLSAKAASFGAAMPMDIREEYERQTRERDQEVKKAAVTEILNLIENKDAFLVNNQTRIAALQEEIDGLNALQKQVQRATMYGVEKQNYVPLMAILGMPISSEAKKELRTIPKDWEPTPAPAAPAAASA